VVDASWNTDKAEEFEQENAEITENLRLEAEFGKGGMVKSF
jgi:hypothetical protein